MDQFSYHNASESRTVGQQTASYKSVQAWKKPAQRIPQEPAPSFNSDFQNKITTSKNSAKNEILAGLEKASDGRVGHFDVEIETAQAYAPQQNLTNAPKAQEEGFQFRDVVDIANPLQHLPLVGMAYRGLTGDELHPMSQIIGGALYGGPIGAVTGTINAISKVQTGKDLGDHALELAGLSKPKTNALNFDTSSLDNAGNQTLPEAAQAFVPMAETKRAAEAYERVQMASGRTAGSMNVKKNWAKPVVETPPTPNLPDINTLSKHEAVSSISLSAMPPRREA